MSQAWEAWESTADGYRCTRDGHQSVEFLRSEVCPYCVSDPGPEIDLEGDDDHEDREIRRTAQEYQSRARFLWRHGHDLIDSGTALDCSVGAKLVAESTKLERLAGERFETLAARAHDKRLLAHEKQMAGLRRSN